MAHEHATQNCDVRVGGTPGEAEREKQEGRVSCPPQWQMWIPYWRFYAFLTKWSRYRVYPEGRGEIE